MAKILVTGGSGFLGSHIADILTANGHGVTIYDCKDSLYRTEDQNFIRGDIKDGTSVNNAVKGNDYVYHLAALADLNEAKKKPLQTVQVNIKGTLNVLEACRNNNVKKMLFGSTVYVYSREGGFYRCSKQACENYIEEYHQCYGITYTILRYGSLYGPRSNESNGVYRLLKSAMLRNNIVYNGKPEDKREYIHVKDAACLSMKALDDQFNNKHLVLTGIDRISAADLFTMFKEMLNKEVTVQFNDDPIHRHYQVTPYAFSPKAGEKLVANPYIDMGQGLLEVIDQIYNMQTDEKYY